MSEKRASGLLKEILADEIEAGDPLLPGFKLRIIKIQTVANERHIGTVAEVVDANGTIRQTKPKDYTLRDCSRVRTLNQQESGGKKRQPRSMRIRPSRSTFRSEKPSDA